MNIDRVEFNPCIIALAGPPYSGKTTLGIALRERTNLQFVDVNPGRWLFPKEGGEFRSPLLRSMAMTESYALAHFRTSEHLEQGRPVVVAATYSHGSYIDMLRGFADLHRRVTLKLDEAALRIFVLEVPEESLPEREQARIRMNDEKYFPHIPLETVIDLRRRYVPIEGADVVHINTGLPLEENVAQVLAELEQFRIAK